MSLTGFVTSLQLFKSDFTSFRKFRESCKNIQTLKNLHMHELQYIALTMPRTDGLHLLIARNLDTVAKCMVSNYEFQLCVCIDSLLSIHRSVKP